jgi:predicted nicotinamide N-methyase
MNQLIIKKTIETFQFGHFEFCLERIVNLDDLVDQISDDVFNIDERLPYWAELWPSAIGLSRYILKNKNYFENKTILELGCGLGMTSLCLSHCTPSEFLVTDYEEEALNTLQTNFMINNISPPETKLMDWRQPDLDRKYQVIIGSDILYESKFFIPLLNLFGKLLSPGGNIFIAEPNRKLGKKFFELAQQRGYFVHSEVEKVKQDGKEIQVNICLLKRYKN